MESRVNTLVPNNFFLVSLELFPSKFTNNTYITHGKIYFDLLKNNYFPWPSTDGTCGNLGIKLGWRTICWGISWLWGLRGLQMNLKIDSLIFLQLSHNQTVASIGWRHYPFMSHCILRRETIIYLVYPQGVSICPQWRKKWFSVDHLIKASNKVRLVSIIRTTKKLCGSCPHYWEDSNTLKYI